MTYFPLFAFFQNSFSFVEIMNAIAPCLEQPAHQFQIVREGYMREAVLLTQQELQNALMQKNSDDGISSVLISTDAGHALEIHQPVPHQMTIDIWDFDAEAYDADVITLEMIQEKEEKIDFLMAHLIRAGADLVYVSGAADNYVGEPHHDELATQIKLALLAKAWAQIATLLTQKRYFWKVAVPVASPLCNVLPTLFRRLKQPDQQVQIWTDPQAQPAVFDAGEYF